MPDSQAVPIRSLILVPAVITLAITLLRLAGELLHWSPLLFNPAAGGGAALVGISWLPLLLGPYFAVRLVRAGSWPGRTGRGVALVLLALAFVPVSGLGAGALGVDPQSLTMLVFFVVASIAAVPIALRAWPELGHTLLTYAFAARVPVAILMLFAILGSWGTHYDAAPPGFPEMGAWARWLWIGLVPQMTIWIAYTVVVGALCGIVAGAIASRHGAAAA